MKKLLFAISSLCIAHFVHAAPEANQFESVSDESKPWCYWWWVNGNVDDKTIAEDLKAMKKIGFGGFLMFDSRGYWDDEDHLVLPKPACEFMDDYWRARFKFAMEEAKRLGLKASGNLSNSGGRLKGP